MSRVNPLTQIEPPATQAELEQEYRVLQQFLHLAPVGLLRIREDGDITVMNPMAAQLLAPLGLGQGDFNLFNLLEAFTQDIRLLCQTFHDVVGIICENFRIVLPSAAQDTDGPWALGLTILRVSAVDDPLMVVVTDQTGAYKLQRLQSSFLR